MNLKEIIEVMQRVVWYLSSTPGGDPAVKDLTKAIHALKQYEED